MKLEQAIDLLKTLIATPSISRDEAAAAAVVKMARDEYNVYLTVEQVLDLYNDQSDANILKFAFILALFIVETAA